MRRAYLERLLSARRDPGAQQGGRPGGSFLISPTAYPPPETAPPRALSSSGCSVRITVSFLLREEVTFLTGNALRTMSLTWLSHMLHIMPVT